MPWFNVCDTFAFDEKAVAAGNAAIGLWTRAGSWSAQQLTDGFVPKHMVTALGGSTSQVRRLVDVGLWQKADGGYHFVDWNSAQSTRKEVEQQRAAARERMRRLRADGRSGEHAAPVQGEVHPNMASRDEETKEKSQKIRAVDQTVITESERPATDHGTASAQVTDLRSGNVRANTPRTSPAVTPTPTRPSPTSSPSPPAHNAAATADSGGGGGSTRNESSAAFHTGAAAEVLHELGSPWRLGPQAIAKLTPAVAGALHSGWNPQDLAAHLRSSPDGVRNSYAVLAARLDDLPPPASRPRRPEWCRRCDETTRMRETDDNRPYRCPDCHPVALRGDPSADPGTRSGAA